MDIDAIRQLKADIRKKIEEKGHARRVPPGILISQILIVS